MKIKPFFLNKLYLILEEKQYRIIFDRQYLESIDTINRKIKAHLETMSKFKNRVLDERLTPAYALDATYCGLGLDCTAASTIL